MTLKLPRLLTVIGALTTLGALLLTGNQGATTVKPTASHVLVSVPLKVPQNLAQAPFDQPRAVTVPTGWHASVYARVSGARLAVWTPDHRLLISRPGYGDVVVLTPVRTASAQPHTNTLISGLQKPHGLAFKGNTLYIAESNQVDTYHYAAGKLSAHHVLIGNLPDDSTAELRGAYAHALKSVAIAKDGAVYVSIGSTGNISAVDRTATPQRAVILRVKNGKTSVYARGVRNGTGLAVAPDGALWTAVNNRDQVAYPYTNGYLAYGQVATSYVNDHPEEPVAKLTPGRDLGWPYCNPDPDLHPGALNTPLAYGNRPFIRDQETNADGSKLNCAALPRVEQGLPAHSAPLGMAFVTAKQLPTGWGAGALVAVHGSWDRTPPRNPRVVFFPWHAGSLGGAYTLITGFQQADGSRWGRPVSAVPGPDGAIYVTDDQAGAVYRLTYTSTTR